ncbi:hypothetical protein [Holophaga foetida]|uniref:hypothetical protein n=1 Tax=Holophaga foetida TaxID=35839 RepID=UPI0002474962|nr:hypothetical protein [Holophaga foetida]
MAKTTDKRINISVSISQVTKILLATEALNQLKTTGKQPAVSALIEQAVLKVYGEPKGSIKAVAAAPKPTKATAAPGGRIPKNAYTEEEKHNLLVELQAVLTQTKTSTGDFQRAIGITKSDYANWKRAQDGKGAVSYLHVAKVREWLASNPATF